MKKTLFIVTALVATAAWATVTVQDKGESSVDIYQTSEGRTVFETVTTDYNVAPALMGEDLVIKTVRRENIAAGLEGSSAQTTTTALKKDGLNFTKVWSVSDESHETQYRDDFIITTKYGCCGAESQKNVYRINDGHLLVKAVGDQIFKLEVPNSNPHLVRWIAKIHDYKKTIDLGNKKRKVNVGTIGYFDDKKGVLSKARVWVTMPDTWGADIVEMKLVSKAKVHIHEEYATLWNSDGISDPQKAFKEVGINFKVFEENTHEATVEVSGDKLVLKGKTTLEVDIE